jgi:general secretion pathway protein D
MIPRFLLPAVLLTGSILPSFSAQAQQNQPLNVADPAIIAESERAIVRSQEDLVKAQSLMKQAQAAPSDQEAFEYASESISRAPTGAASAKIRASLVDSYTSIALTFAQTLINRGDFTDKNAKDSQIHDSKGNLLSAEGVLKSILLPSINPGNVSAKQMLSNLEQPGIYNKTVTPESSAQRDKVINKIRAAENYMQSGRYALALRMYEEALELDPYNSSARKGMEAIHNADIKYANEAYNETRSEMLWKVEKSWERPPRKSKQGRTTESIGRQQEARGTEQIIEKLKSIVIDKIDLNDTPLSEARLYLTQKSKSDDLVDKKGVNIVVKTGTPSAPPSSPPALGSSNTPFPTTQQSQSITAQSAEPHVTLSLNHVPLYVVLDYIAKLSNMKLKIEPNSVWIVPLSEPTASMETKTYKVPPTFIPDKSLDATGSLPQPGSSGLPDPNKARLAQRMDAKEYLLQQGVEFPDGASAYYNYKGSKLVVRNTHDNIDEIDALVDAATVGAPSQVDIETKFLEINQNNVQELGFDWLLGPVFINSGNNYKLSGGGIGTNVDGANYPFGNPKGVMNPVGGLRSGDQSITGNSIDSLLAGQIGVSTAPAPGIFSIAGVFSEPQFQLVIRALNQKKGIDLMSAPKVTTKSGAKATIKIVDEFIYPRQYQPPQIPQTTSNSTGAPPSITPAFPTDFTKQDLGVTLDAQPTIDADGVTIDLELNPRVVDFDGFINYGSPINSVGYVRTAESGFTTWNPIVQTLTTNTINQPVFSTREVNTRVTVWDGYTVALGGLIREDIQKVQDKVPFLGDMPLAGRLFRSEADQKVKKNLMIFVTPRIRDADGQLRKDEVDDLDMEKPLAPISDLPDPNISTATSRSK